MGFQPSDGLWKRKLHYIQQPARIRIKRTLPLHWIYQADALPYPRKRSKLLCWAHFKGYSLPFPFLSSYSQDKCCQKQTEVESSNLTQNNLRNYQSHEWSWTAITSVSRRSRFVALPTCTQAGWKPHTFPTDRQPQKGPCVPALSIPWGQTYPVQSVFAEILGSKTHLREEPVLFQSRRL